MTREEPFIGRIAEQRAFAAAVEEIAENRRSFWSTLAGPSRSRTQPRVFLISGSGAMGKKLLLSRFELECRDRP
ncbi:MAG TPA: hypothetical protein VG778_11185, partial [Blastocatellia bacterium]|nr:hypothetical protein [Blastocatellia bacterium]